MDKHPKNSVKSLSSDCNTGKSDPALDSLVEEIIGRVADKWTMIILEVLEEQGKARFSQIAKLVPGISQKMLTKTLRLMERDGLLIRTIYPVIPPHVDYCLTDLGKSLGGAFCGVWLWAEEHHAAIERARKAFAAREGETLNL
jgi:DNA-binding HxlR family transcriptional regulator